MEERPPEKRLQVAPFTVHATRGLLRDPKMRRKTMAILLIVALVMMVLGFFGLAHWLEPREHPARFILFWFVCAWVTLTTLLLALLDLLLVRAEARRARQALREKAGEASGLIPPE
jgi:biotin transporter BioY